VRDLTHRAGRFADHLVAMKDGRIVASGAPADIVDAALMADVFDLPSVVVPHPSPGRRWSCRPSEPACTGCGPAVHSGPRMP
jgi:ABC-type cobalamin/Fe3+-siderophores transport system ATPase subunit